MIDWVWEYEVRDEHGNILLHGFGRENFVREWKSMPHRPGEKGIGFEWQVRWWKTYGLGSEDEVRELVTNAAE